MKYLYPLLILLFVQLTGVAQTIEQIALRIADDTATAIWKHKVDPKIYYKVGKIIAERDIKKHIYLIQTYGNPDHEKPCSVCAWERYGFKLEYNWDIVFDEKTNFIEGYNEVSKAYLKSMIGDSAYAVIEKPTDNFDPEALLSNFKYSSNRQKFYDIEVENKNAIRIKLKVDSIFKGYPSLVEKIVYNITASTYNAKSKDSMMALTYQQMKQSGFVVHKNIRGDFAYYITFDLSQLPASELFCGCTFKKNIYTLADRLQLRLTRLQCPNRKNGPIALFARF
ncbi:MAG TPA: hypothetical protein VF008_30840 [Niastella sp.]